MAEQGRAVGRVEQLWIYPVKSLSGTSVASAEIGDTGLAGDRAWTVVGPDGAVVRAKDEPAMAAVHATGDPAVDAATLSAALGRTVRLEAGHASAGAAPVHLVSRQGIERAALGEVPEGCSADDPRANLVLDLEGGDDEGGDDEGGDDERAWVGRLLRVGTAVLEITRTPKHCLGVYAEVRQPGSVTLGDRVLL
ncbi:MAG: domain protein beta barrel domain protein [Blastococcus sp.]|nr:domain protein beta barrel domain protein [Blastococcus sp.]